MLETCREMKWISALKKCIKLVISKNKIMDFFDQHLKVRDWPKYIQAKKLICS